MYVTASGQFNKMAFVLDQDSFSRLNIHKNDWFQGVLLDAGVKPNWILSINRGSMSMWRGGFLLLKDDSSLGLADRVLQHSRLDWSEDSLSVQSSVVLVAHFCFVLACNR